MFNFIDRPSAPILKTMNLSKILILAATLLVLVERSSSQDFTAITTGALVDDAGAARGVSWIDFNNDGFLDLFVTRGPRQGQTALLFRNDGDLDLFVANEENQNNNLYKNLLKESGNATFEKITNGAAVTDGSSSWTASWGDYDNDGDLDLFVGNFGNQNNFFYRNDGRGIFTKITDGVLVNDPGYSACSGWGDYDNDGDLDLYVTQAYGQVALKNFLYRNLLMESGAPAFEKTTTGPAVNDLGYSYGFSWADFDRDGDLDLFAARTLNENQKNAFYINNLNGKSWLQVRAVGMRSNKSAIGAKIRVKAKIGGKAVWQRRDIAGQEGYCGQNLLAHFGLGDAAVIDTVLVQWPSGIVDVLAPVNVNQILTITEGMNPTKVEQQEVLLPSGYRLQQNYPNPFRSAATFPALSGGNLFTRIEYVLPRASHVRLIIYNGAGQEVRTLVDQTQSIGTHEKLWDGKNNMNESVPSGVYFYHIVAGQFQQTRKMLLLQ